MWWLLERRIHSKSAKKRPRASSSSLLQTFCQGRWMFLKTSASKFSVDYLFIRVSEQIEKRAVNNSGMPATETGLRKNRCHVSIIAQIKAKICLQMMQKIAWRFLSAR